MEHTVFWTLEINKHEGPEGEMCLACSRNAKEAMMTTVIRV